MDKKQNLTASNPETVTISRAEYEKFQAQSKRISELESRVDVLMEALRLARHKQFGTSSEKSEEPLMEQLSFLFNEAEVFAEVSTKQEEAVVVAAHKRHKKHEYTLDNIPEGIPTKQVEHRLEGEELVCPQCGDTMTEIGKEVVRTLEIIPARTIVREDIYYTYACKSCSENADEGCETPMVKAPKEKNIIPGSFATPEAVAHIMTQKFVMGCPLYRQEQDLNRRGHSPEPPDYVQLDPESHRELSDACV
ncbi:MAG: transposase [Oscillospiraceae bacterium]